MMFVASAIRQFKRAKQYYLTTVMTLSITLSMVLSVVSLVDLVFFAPLPYQNSENLYLLEGTLSSATFDGGIGTNPQLISHIRKNNDVFTDVATYHSWSSYRLYDQKERPEVEVILASSNLFNLLGIEPELGRLFSQTESLGTKQHSVILSYRLWQNSYHGDNNIIGKKIQLNQRRFTVIGVAPDDLVLPQYSDINEAVWIPMDMDENFDVKTSKNFMGAYKGIVRLKQNVDLEQVGKQINRLTSEGAELYTADISKNFILKAKVTLFSESLQGDSGTIVLMLFVGVLLLMVIALINLSSMQLAKAVTKIKSVAISFAFGASNKQLLLESFKHNFLVVGFAVILALLMTISSFTVVQSMAENSIQRLDTLSISFNTLLFSAFLTILIALLYSYIELRVVNEKNLISSLQSSGKGVGKQMSSGASHILIGMQIMFSFIVLVAASHVALKTLTEAFRDDGINSDNKWSLTINYGNIINNAERENIHKSLLIQMMKLNSVADVNSTSEARIPLALNTNPLYDDQNNYIASTRKIHIDAGYLPSLDIAIIGDNFKQGDSELENYPVIINQRLADVIAKDPAKVLGQKITADGKTFHSIIGIAANTYVPGDAGYEVHEVYDPRKYKSWRQYSFLLTASDMDELEQQVRELISKVDSRLEVVRLIPIEQLFYQKRSRQIIAAWISIVLACISLLMVCLGLNGIVNYMVQVRRYDLGVKLAMGADNLRLLKDSLGELMLPVTVSLFFAFSLSFLGLGYSKSLPDLTVDVNWLLIAVILVCFVLISLLVSFFPIQKILKHDPIKALRNE